MSPTSRSTPESTRTDLDAASSPDGAGAAASRGGGAGAHGSRATSRTTSRGRSNRHLSNRGPANGGAAHRGAERGTAVAWGAFGVLVTLAAWWVFTHAAAGGSTMIAAFRPEQLPGAVGSLLDRGVVLQDAATSLWRLLGGLLLAAVLGVPLGLMIGAWRRVRWASAPLVQFLRMVSPLSWAPVAVALFGVGSAPVVFLVAAAAVWPIALNTAAGVAALDPAHLRVARTLGATPVERLRTVVLPSIRPHVMTGVRLALGISWVVLVPAEMLGVSTGLGYEILNARDRLAYDEMLVVILAIGLLGIALDALAQWLLRDRVVRT